MTEHRTVAPSASRGGDTLVENLLAPQWQLPVYVLEAAGASLSDAIANGCF